MAVRCLNDHHGDDFSVYHGDCVLTLAQFPDNCVDFSVYSPPFASIFTYSSSVADHGNCADDAEFRKSYAYLVGEKLRVTKPGRLTAVHCSDLPSTKWKDGHVGIKDFSGDIIRIHEDAGWIYHGRKTIWRSPVVEMTRTKHVGLLYKQLRADSSKSRGGLADYLLHFVKPGVNAEPIRHTPEDFPLDQWQEWASPVWMTVNQTRVLSVKGSKGAEDERHVCPLQLDVIERALILWSNKGDTVLSPYAGIGSEGYCSVRFGRKFVGTELKREYFDQAVQNIGGAAAQGDMFAAGSA